MTEPEPVTQQTYVPTPGRVMRANNLLSRIENNLERIDAHAAEENTTIPGLRAQLASYLDVLPPSAKRIVEALSTYHSWKPEAHEQLLRSLEYRGLNYEAVANDCNTSVQAVKVHLCRAKAKDPALAAWLESLKSKDLEERLVQHWLYSDIRMEQRLNEGLSSYKEFQEKDDVRVEAAAKKREERKDKEMALRSKMEAELGTRREQTKADFFDVKRKLTLDDVAEQFTPNKRYRVEFPDGVEEVTTTTSTTAGTPSETVRPPVVRSLFGDAELPIHMVEQSPARTPHYDAPFVEFPPEEQSVIPPSPSVTTPSVTAHPTTTVPSCIPIEEQLRLAQEQNKLLQQQILEVRMHSQAAPSIQAGQSTLPSRSPLDNAIPTATSTLVRPETLTSTNGLSESSERTSTPRETPMRPTRPKPAYETPTTSASAVYSSGSNAPLSSLSSPWTFTSDEHASKAGCNTPVSGSTAAIPSTTFGIPAARSTAPLASPVPSFIYPAAVAPPPLPTPKASAENATTFVAPSPALPNNQSLRPLSFASPFTANANPFGAHLDVLSSTTVATPPAPIATPTRSPFRLFYPAPSSPLPASTGNIGSIGNMSAYTPLPFASPFKSTMTNVLTTPAVGVPPVTSPHADIEMHGDAPPLPKTMLDCWAASSPKNNKLLHSGSHRRTFKLAKR